MKSLSLIVIVAKWRMNFLWYLKLLVRSPVRRKTSLLLWGLREENMLTQFLV